MHDVGRVRRAEAGEQLARERRRLPRAEPAARLEALRERLAFEQLHHEEARRRVPRGVLGGEVAHVEHLDDVGRPDAACGLRLALEAMERSRGARPPWAGAPSAPRAGG